LSRRGLLPREHGPAISPAPPPAEKISGEVSELLHIVRTRASEIGWRAAVDQLRPHTQDIWQAATLSQRRRFLRHLRPWWDVHRHRLAPQIGRRIAELRQAGRLQVLAGHVAQCSAGPQGVALTYVPRGSRHPEHLTVDRLVNCTGPQTDPAATDSALLCQLLTDGIAMPDALGLGLDVDAQARLLNAYGDPRKNLLALGPITRGTFWEITAVPDIRIQTWQVARQLSNAHWVAWEGL